MTNISEKLMKVKNVEAELLRAIEIRDEIISKTFSPKTWETEKKTAKQIEVKEKEFLKDRKVRLADISKKIESLKSELLLEKHEINKHNIEAGLDTLILEIKWLRIELSKLMVHMKGESYMKPDSEYLEKLGVQELVKNLESKKQELDTKLQQINHSTKV